MQLTGPIQVIHQAKACCDVKGGKNELSFKQGEQIEIIRITDNPEGKWLGRTARGSCEYKFSYDISKCCCCCCFLFLRHSVKLGVFYRVDKNRKIENDIDIPSFHLHCLFTGEQCKYLFYSREKQRALVSSLMLKGEKMSPVSHCGIFKIDSRLIPNHNSVRL